MKEPQTNKAEIYNSLIRLRFFDMVNISFGTHCHPKTGP